MANPNAAAASVTLTLVDFYAEVEATVVLVVPPFGQITFDPQILEGLGSEYPDSNFVGSITVSSPVLIGALVVQDTYGPFAATPVMSGRAK